MKIELTCRDDRKFEMKVEVYALSFHPDDKTFSMPYCVGDDWLQKLRCPLAVVPNRFHFQWDRVFISYDRKEDAEAFGAWLIEAEAEAQHGYRTMRG
jgi:hypothetical protein